MGPLSHMRLYLANESGISNCLGAATGKKPCLVARGSGANASPLQAGGSVYASSETGTMIVFSAADRLLLVARNEIKKGMPDQPGCLRWAALPLHCRESGRHLAG